MNENKVNSLEEAITQLSKATADIQNTLQKIYDELFVDTEGHIEEGTSQPKKLTPFDSRFSVLRFSDKLIESENGYVKVYDVVKPNWEWKYNGSVSPAYTIKGYVGRNIDFGFHSMVANPSDPELEVCELDSSLLTIHGELPDGITLNGVSRLEGACAVACKTPFSVELPNGSVKSFILDIALEADVQGYLDQMTVTRNGDEIIYESKVDEYPLVDEIRVYTKHAEILAPAVDLLISNPLGKGDHFVRGKKYPEVKLGDQRGVKLRPQFLYIYLSWGDAITDPEIERIEIDYLGKTYIREFDEQVTGE